MGNNVERLLTDMERENQTFVSLRRLREAIEADREEGIEVEVTVREVTGAKIRVHDLHTEEPIQPGPYTLIKREAGDSEEAPPDYPSDEDTAYEMRIETP